MCVKKREAWLPLHKICMLVPLTYPPDWLTDPPAGHSSFTVCCQRQEAWPDIWPHCTVLHYRLAYPTPTTCPVPLQCALCHCQSCHVQERWASAGWPPGLVQGEDDINLCKINPAYGRHWISWRVRIIAPIPKRTKTKKMKKLCFFYINGALLNQKYPVHREAGFPNVD